MAPVDPDRASQASLRAWLERRTPHWQRLAKLVGNPRDARGESSAAAMELAERFRSLARDRSLAHDLMPGSRLARDLDALFGKAHELVYRPPRRIWRSLVTVMGDEVPAIVRDMRGSIAAVSALFMATAVFGWLLVSRYPELASLFASSEMIGEVERGELWTDGLLNVVPSSVLSVSIMANNIVVSLTAFAFGAFFGIGTAYIIGLNGFMLGGVFAFTHQYGLAERLFSFVVAHGVVELSVICLAGAAGLQLGNALVRPGPRTRAAAFQHEAGRAAKLLPVIALFLVGAGLIEGFISPDPDIPLWLRITVGVSYGVLLWMVLTGRDPLRRSG